MSQPVHHHLVLSLYLPQSGLTVAEVLALQLLSLSHTIQKHPLSGHKHPNHEHPVTADMHEAEMILASAVRSEWLNSLYCDLFNPSHAAHRRHVSLRQQQLPSFGDVNWLQVFGL